MGMKTIPLERLLLATRNRGKIRELRRLLSGIPGIELLTFEEIPFSEVEETEETFLDNALLKAEAILEQTGLPVLAEDAGLEVLSLGGEPGVRSARYAGGDHDYSANNSLLLKRLEGVMDRRARFITVAVLLLPDRQVFVTTGVLPGEIADAPRGEGGFGYDPLFIPAGGSRTLAELSLEEKNRISHRMRAIRRMRLIIRDLVSQG